MNKGNNGSDDNDDQTGSIIDTMSDWSDKLASKSKRIERTIDRANRMAKKNVSPDAILAQLNARRVNGVRWNHQDLGTFQKLDLQCTTRVGVTKKQTDALIKDAEDSEKDCENSDFE